MLQFSSGRLTDADRGDNCIMVTNSSIVSATSRPASLRFDLNFNLRPVLQPVDLAGKIARDGYQFVKGELPHVVSAVCTT